MKEIDFLPKWYKNRRRRQSRYRTQCIALGIVFLIMVAWDFTMAHSVSMIKDELLKLESDCRRADVISREYVRINSEVAKLQSKADILGDIRPKSHLKAGSVLCEMSYLTGERVVLSSVDFLAERVLQGNKTADNDDKVGVGFGDRKFRVLIGGVAADAADVAGLVCRLEESKYFRRICASLSRDKRTRRGNDRIQEQGQLTEFEISCYLANYRREKGGFAKAADKMFDSEGL